MDGWFDGSATNSTAVFLNVYNADAFGYFNWNGKDGWLARVASIPRPWEYTKVSFQNYATMDEGMGDGPRHQFRGQMLDIINYISYFCPRNYGWFDGWSDLFRGTLQFSIKHACYNIIM